MCHVLSGDAWGLVCHVLSGDTWGLVCHVLSGNAWGLVCHVLSGDTWGLVCHVLSGDTWGLVCHVLSGDTWGLVCHVLSGNTWGLVCHVRNKQQRFLCMWNSFMCLINVIRNELLLVPAVPAVICGRENWALIRCCARRIAMLWMKYLGQFTVCTSCDHYSIQSAEGKAPLTAQLDGT